MEEFRAAFTHPAVITAMIFIYIWWFITPSKKNHD